jgi:predicted nuclease of restriction endonuclease-like RecB superfamily
VLTKDLLRVSRHGGGYRPAFVGEEAEDLAARLIGVYQGHVGESRADLDAALEDLEREHEDFKLVRGFAKLLEREAVFETRAPIDPERARRHVFEAAEAVGVATTEQRRTALERAADGLGVEPADLEASLYADLPDRQVLAAFDPRWDPGELVAQYDLSLAQTALFDATEARIRCSDPKALVSAIKRLGLLYEIHLPESRDPGDPIDLSTREVRVTGPDSLFRRTRRYGTSFARLLRTLATQAEWRLTATIDDRGTERELTLDSEDPIRVPGTEPVADVEFDSSVEADFATRFEALDLDWTLVREPDVLAAGDRAMIPDFAFVYDHADFRVYFEIMGFWTPEYVREKLAKLEATDVELLVAYDESLGVGEDLAARDHRAIGYSGTVRIKAVRDALREYEADLVAASADRLPDELVPADDAVTLAALAERHGVSEAALEEKSVPEHRRVGRTLVRPAVLSDLAATVEPGMTLSELEPVLEERGIDDASAVLAELGYRVEWEGLNGGTVREK